MDVAVDREHVPQLVQQDVADGASPVVAGGLLDARLELPALRGLERRVLLPRGPRVRGEFPEHRGVEDDEAAHGLAPGIEEHVGEARAAEIVHEPDAGEPVVEGAADGRRQVRDGAAHVGEEIVRQPARARVLGEAVEAHCRVAGTRPAPPGAGPSRSAMGRARVGFQKAGVRTGCAFIAFMRQGLSRDRAGRGRRRLGQDRHGPGEQKDRERPDHRSSKSSRTGWWSETCVSRSTRIARTRGTRSSLTKTKSQQ